MRQITFAAVFAILLANVCFGQEEPEVHSDIEFGYTETQTEIEVENDERTSEGIQVFESSFNSLGGDLFTDAPGFITAADEGLVVNEGDQVFVRILNAGDSDATEIGAGFVNFYDPANPTAGVQALGSISIGSGQLGAGGTNTVFDGATVQGNESIFLSVASDGTQMSNPIAGEEPELLGVGEIHNHLLFDLLDEANTPPGAVGLLLQFEADLAGTGPEIDVVSEPFFLIFNTGLDEEVFEGEALAAFGLVEGGLVGDFDGDEDVDVDDIDFYFGLIPSDATGELAQLDLNGDGQITLDDLTTHVETYVQTSNGQTGTFRGDLNLDGSVDVLNDAFTLVANLGNLNATSYGQGDLNVDGVVNVLGDAFVLVANLGSSNEE